jgi:hypothetical protein
MSDYRFFCLFVFFFFGHKPRTLDCKEKRENIDPSQVWLKQGATTAPQIRIRNAIGLVKWHKGLSLFMDAITFPLYHVSLKAIIFLALHLLLLHSTRA